MLNTILLAQSAGDAGLTFGEVLRDIPHDGPAFVAYALIIGFAYMVWRGSRPKKGL